MLRKLRMAETLSRARRLMTSWSNRSMTGPERSMEAELSSERLGNRLKTVITMFIVGIVFNNSIYLTNCTAM